AIERSPIFQVTGLERFPSEDVIRRYEAASIERPPGGRSDVRLRFKRINPNRKHRESRDWWDKLAKALQKNRKTRWERARNLSPEERGHIERRVPDPSKRNAIAAILARLDNLVDPWIPASDVKKKTGLSRNTLDSDLVNQTDEERREARRGAAGSSRE